VPPKLDLAHSTDERTDALPSAFQCSWTDGAPDAAWVRLAGELDIATAPRLERLLREPRLQARVIVLDLRDLAFMDSSGVHAIVDASVRSRRAGRRMLLLRGRPGVDRVFTLTESAEDVGNGDIHAVEPSAQALRGLIEEEAAS
jgi:anti-sigma B factor antagonist